MRVLLAFIYENCITKADFWIMTIRMTTPILFAALGSCIAKKSGVFNMSMDGLINSTAFISVIVDGFVRAYVMHGQKKADIGEEAYAILKAKANTWGWVAGIIGGMIFGILFQLMFAYFVIDLKANPSLTGIGANLLIAGLAPFLSMVITGNKANTNAWKDMGLLPKITIPYLSEIPFLKVLFTDHSILTYVCIVCIIIVNILLFRTPLGLRIRAVGENPDSAESVGIDVRAIQYKACILCGLFGSMGGTFMSLGYVNFWVRNISAGRGYIGLAAATLGQGNPIATTIYAYLFGWFDALGLNCRARPEFTSQFLSMLPYVATLVGLILYSIVLQNKIKKAKAAR